MLDIRVAAVTLVVCVATGCGGPKLAQVSGRVTVGGVPVTQGRVVFYPEQSRPAAAEIGPDGRYTLTTFGANDGALIGVHKVTVESWETLEIVKDKEYGVKWHTPSQYANMQTSPLTAEVKRGPNEINFDLPSVGK